MDAYKNFAYSLVATAPSPATSGTSLVVTAADGTKFPAVPFNATIWATGANPITTNAEIVTVTAIATDTLTIVRAQEGSSARTVVVGDQIAATITAKVFTEILSNSVAVTVAQGGTGLATLTSSSILVGAGTSNVTFIAPGTGVATALAVNLNAAGGLSPIDGTATLTNKRVTARITTITSNATPTVNTDNSDCVTITAQAVAITSMTTNLSGTPVDFDQLEYRIKDNGTARAITWGTSFVSGNATLPTTTTISKALHVWFEYDSVQAKWVCVGTGSDA